MLFLLSEARWWKEEYILYSWDCCLLKFYEDAVVLNFASWWFSFFQKLSSRISFLSNPSLWWQTDVSVFFIYKKCFRKHQILEHLHKTSSFILSTMKHLKTFISRCPTLVFHFKLILLYQLNLTTLYNRSNCFPIIQKGVYIYSAYFALRFIERNNLKIIITRLITIWIILVSNDFLQNYNESPVMLTSRATTNNNWHVNWCNLNCSKYSMSQK